MTQVWPYVLVSNCACNFPHGLRLNHVFVFWTAPFSSDLIFWIITRLRNQIDIFLVQVSFQSSRIGRFFRRLPRHAIVGTLHVVGSLWPEYFMRDACPNLSV